MAAGERLIDFRGSRVLRLGLASALAVLAVAGLMAVATVGQRTPGTVPANQQGSVAPNGNRPAIATPAAVARIARPVARADDAGMAAIVEVAARKYRISSHAMREFVDVAYAEARRNRLDPLLIVAVMAVESRFNPAAQSDFGATGLMQVIPRYHADKFSPAAGESVLDPRINIRVGARVLRDSVTRGGNETAGLQLYNGSASDPSRSYAAKVLAERARLREAMRHTRVARAREIT
jgi:soluble lytic murein transglycosylase-like protein